MNKQSRWIALIAILGLAAALRGWNLGDGGVLVPYYFAGVRSMLQSWHNFFFDAFDPAGFLSLDKPPLAFWAQTLSAKLLGFNRVAVLLPQVVEGVAAVALLYWLVQRRFGATAGLLAALFLAVTPVAVAVDRSNNTESCLVLVLLLAAWAAVVAIETDRLLPLFAAAALIGLGFNVKMLVAFGVAPAFALAYLLGSSLPVRQRIGRLAAAGAVLVPIALSWSVIYELTPPEDRPFVDSTEDNSMLELAVGHNFVQRFVRRADAHPREAASTTSAAGQPAGSRAERDYVPAGPLRLAAPPLAAELLWLLPLVLIGGIAAWRQFTGPPRLNLVIWAVWAAAYAIVFSAAGGIFHSYYIAVMAPALCALAGIGTVALWQDRKTRMLWPTVLVAIGLWQAYILAGFYRSGLIGFGDPWLVPVWLGIAVTLALAAMLRPGPLARPIAAGGLALALVPPAAWCAATSAAAFRAEFPTAHAPFETSAARGNRDRSARFGGAIEGDPKLLAFLEQGAGSRTYLLAVVNARQAAPIIITTGSPVMAFGGFSGRDPILSVEDFAHRVAARQVRYALVGDDSRATRRGVREDPQKPLVDWIRNTGREVDPALWRGMAANAATASADGHAQSPAESAGIQLYDLAPAD
jgi:4-amino-4-deoxy-L-arabinose transferase-like glycosyltransferase